MDSSINTAKPYKEKTFRSKLPVRKPRAPKTPMPISTSLISPVERAAIKAGQAKLIKETQTASATKIANAFRSKLARKAVKNVRAGKAMDTAGNVLAGATIARMIKAKVARDNAITVPIPKPKKEKVKYKISYSAALKQWNMSHSRNMWCNPRKGTEDYKAVVALRL